jgi:hypothetical protein
MAEWTRVAVADLTDCPDCQAHATGNLSLSAACASVGIEHGASAGEMMRRYLAVFHRRGHRDETGGRGRA